MPEAQAKRPENIHVAKYAAPQKLSLGLVFCVPH